MTRKFGIAALLLISALWLGLAQAADIENVRLWRAPDNTRVVFDLSGPVEHTVFQLNGPRLVVDIREASLKTDLDALSLVNTPIKAVRSARRNGRDLRVVFDLSAAVDPNSFVLAKTGDKLDRLVLDLYDLGSSQPAPSQPARVVTEADNNARRDVIIAIDAGHGGEDPGALGPRKVQEKDVVLEIAKKLAAIVNKREGYRAELIRSGDYYVPLKKRREAARKMQADLFVSIHADAFKHKSANGASVYTLSIKGATSESALYLAQQENNADMIGGVNVDNLDTTLKGVLLDLSMNATLSSSLDVGDQILSAMGGVARLHKKQVEQANFMVLKSLDMPSILVETGFISNPDDARRLQDKRYQQTLAEKIFTGIDGYFTNKPPTGTYLAWRKNGGTGPVGEHVIARGDTLSGIAKRYNVSVNSLKSLNGLTDSVIRVGQRLKIPTS